jgi:hypothetical protein
MRANINQIVLYIKLLLAKKSALAASLSSMEDTVHRVDVVDIRSRNALDESRRNLQVRNNDFIQ